jgi:cardiolipin synthase
MQVQARNDGMGGKDQTGGSCAVEWLSSGGVGLARMLEAVEMAEREVRLEMYIFEAGGPGEEFRMALVSAAQRGVRVRVLLDAIGSGSLEDDFWRGLVNAGGEVRWFHPLGGGLAVVRSHRKLLACDGRVAFVTGFNIAPEYEGDGVEAGWRDAGVRMEGWPALEIEALLDEQFDRAGHPLSSVVRLRRRESSGRTGCGGGVELLPVSPGRGESTLTTALRADLRRLMAERGRVVLVTPYFVPPAWFRRELRRATRAGASVTVVLPMRSDVEIAQRAARHVYAGLQRAGVRIMEYRPQMLHGKVWCLGDVVYVGTSNLDPRSLHLNYELMARLSGGEVVRRAWADVEDIVARSVEVPRLGWGARSWLARARDQLAFWVLYRIDPWLTGWMAGRWLRHRVRPGTTAPFDVP